MRAYNALVLLVWSGLSCLVRAESEKYPLCYAGFCKDNNCVIQPHNATWPCSELSPCEVEGTECFIDTYPYPDGPMNLGCGGSEAAKAFKKIRSQVDKKPRPEWWGLVQKYNEELSEYWKEREERELKEFDGLLSPFMEKRLRRSGNLPKGYDARKRRMAIEREVREEKERREREEKGASEKREREEMEEKEREEREGKEREQQERKTRAEQENREKAEQEKMQRAEQEKKERAGQEKKEKAEQEKKERAGQEKKEKAEQEKKKIQASKGAEKKAKAEKLRDVVEEAEEEGEQEESEL